MDKKNPAQALLPPRGTTEVDIGSGGRTAEGGIQAVGEVGRSCKEVSVWD